MASNIEIKVVENVIESTSTDNVINVQSTESVVEIHNADGLNGITPHIGENGNWFIGTKDTGVHAQGEKGESGADGLDGKDGLTPYIGENANWFVGDVDLGVKAQGEQGIQGVQGIQGEKGADGKDGKDGENGVDGKSAYAYAVEGGYTGTEQDFNITLSVLADITQAKKNIADAINIKGGNSNENESFAELAEDVKNLNDTFITFGVTTNGEKLDWLKFVTTPNAEDRSFIKEIDNDEITTISIQQCFANCVNLTKIRLNNLTEIIAHNSFYGCTLLQEIKCDNLLRISGQSAFGNCPSLKELNLQNLTSITGANAFAQSPLVKINIPKCGVLSMNGIFSMTNNLRQVVVGTLTSLHINTFGSAGNRMNVLRNVTIGVNTDIDLTFHLWTATNVIAEGQSSIDELNNNLLTNLLEKLYDHSTDGETRTLRLGWLAHVTQENIDYANSKGWTLTT